ncbi:MAG: EAL domain-containing protein, partial [Clostridia bacterium]|nr:EAL domain-containing protein [Clostridia bacterium]
KQLGMKVTQEGISTEEDYERVKSYGCEIMQGYLYAKPMPLADYISFTNSDRPGAFN